MKQIFERAYIKIGRCLGFRAVQEWREQLPMNPHLKILSPKKTLNACREAIENNRAGAYLRFGDGDIVLAQGEPDLCQLPSPELQGEMREAFNCTGESVFKALPLHSEQFGFEAGMVPGVHLASSVQATDMLRKVAEFFVGERIFSAVALHHQSVVDEAFTISFLRVLKRKTQIVIGSEAISSKLLNDLFGEAIHLKTPTINAYETIESTWDEFQARVRGRDNSAHFVIVIALGCSGRVMAKRILHSSINCFVFDFGSLMDAMCGIDTRAWITMTGVMDGPVQRIMAALEREEGESGK